MSLTPCAMSLSMNTGLTGCSDRMPHCRYTMKLLSVQNKIMASRKFDCAPQTLILYLKIKTRSKITDAYISRMFIFHFVFKSMI